MYTRELMPPKGSFFLLGPRGTGKSTWLQSHFGEVRYIDLLDEGLYQQLAARPQEFAEMIAEEKPGSWVVVDEIQRLPGLLNQIHRAIENQKLQFALSGSSARKLRRAGVNLLAGRAVQKFMHPLLPTEMGSDFDLVTAMEYGTLPLVADAEDPQATLGSYVQLYLREEIQAEALVRSLGGFARFLPIAALFHGQAINITGVARDSGVSRSTVRGYVDILEDTLLANMLPAYTSKLRVREKKLPKFYFVDSGIARACKRAHGPVAAEERGALFEGMVHSVLRTHQDYFGIYDGLFYWSPAEAKKTEVDFLLVRGKDKIAIEVKASESVSAKQCKGLRAIADLPGVKRRLVVYTGSRSRKTADGIEIWPYARFCKELKHL